MTCLAKLIARNLVSVFRCRRMGCAKVRFLCATLPACLPTGGLQETPDQLQTTIFQYARYFFRACRTCARLSTPRVSASMSAAVTGFYLYLSTSQGCFRLSLAAAGAAPEADRLLSDFPNVFFDLFDLSFSPKVFPDYIRPVFLPKVFPDLFRPVFLPKGKDVIFSKESLAAARRLQDQRTTTLILINGYCPYAESASKSTKPSRCSVRK